MNHIPTVTIDTRVTEGGSITIKKAPFRHGTQVRVYIFPSTGAQDTLHDLVAAASSSTDFWMTEADEVWDHV